MKQTWWNLAGLGAWILILVLGGSGCGKKAPSAETLKAQEALEQVRAEIEKQDQWMRTGQYQSGNVEWQNKITQAIESFEKLTAGHISLFNDDHVNSLEMELQFRDENFHGRVLRNRQGEPAEFFVLQDRFYSPGNNSFQDNGPDSRSLGERWYKPLLTDMRISIKQALRGEIKDVGIVKYYTDRQAHRYDCRIPLPGSTTEMLTAAVDIDEGSGLLVHVLIGNGQGSESSAKRFAKLFREWVLIRTEDIGPIELPKEIPVLPFESDKNTQKLELR